ncbi:carbonic anhydrase [Agrobacterium sp. NPDC089420]|uniref:carbonic anhydrase n=1 Tax=Agrobacterium sp. NPDC089420 TaxID=3363918 RepID=UPI0038511A24
MTAFSPALLAGYRSFMGGRYSEERERYRTLAEAGQKPHTLVIACCDSRVAPETIFDCGPGELFVVRNIANMVPPCEPDTHLHGTSAALEYAVQVLNIRNIIVMGHGNCGGVKAALDPLLQPLSAGDFIGRWISLVRPAAEQIRGSGFMTAAERQTALERVSIRNSLENLKTFHFVQEALDRGDLDMGGAWFDVASGELWIMNGDGDFVRPNIEEIVTAA